MATNVYFNPFPTNQITSEQLLVEDLLIEALKIYGMDVFYLPRESRSSVDMLYGEDVNKQYVTAYPIELYLENVTGMDGEGDFISKFGLEIRDEISLLVSRRRFASTVPQTRPKEGDLIYVPLVQNFFELTFVEHENNQAMFYTLGRGRGANVYVYALKLKQFVFSNEIIETGIKEIDDQIRDAYPRTLISLKNGNGTFTNEEVVYQGESLNTATAFATVYSHAISNTLTIIKPNGFFAANGIIFGATSGTQRTFVSQDDMTPKDSSFEDVEDNNLFKTESNGLIDFSETNPFSEVVNKYRVAMDSTKISMDNTILDEAYFEQALITMDNED
jgi:hypothetical protein